MSGTEHNTQNQQTTMPAGTPPASTPPRPLELAPVARLAPAAGLLRRMPNGDPPSEMLWGTEDAARRIERVA
jgi:hypothetical protein